MFTNIIRRNLLAILKSPISIFGSALTVSNIISLLATFIFHGATARMLGPEKYGLLIALIALGNSLSAPVASVSLYVTKQVSTLVQTTAGTLSTRLYKRFMQTTLLTVLPLAVLGVASHKLLSFYFDLGDFFSFFGLVTAVFFGVFATVNAAFLQGTKLFFELAWFRVVKSISQLLLTVALLGLNATIPSVFLALALSEIIFSIQANKKLQTQFGQKHEAKSQPFEVKLFAQTLFATTSLTVAFQLDVIFVAWFFDGEIVGIYAAASSIAKIGAYLSTNYVTVMFPLLARGTATKQQKQSLLGLVLFFCIAGTTTSAIILLLIGDFLIYLILGIHYHDVGKTACIICLSYAPLAIIYALEHFFISQGTIITTWVLTAIAPVIVLGVMFSHGEVIHIPIIIGALTTPVALITLAISKK